MNQPLPPDGDSPKTSHSSIQQQANNSVLGGMQAVIGDGNIQIQIAQISEAVKPPREIVDKVEQIVNEYTRLFVGREEEIQEIDKFFTKNSRGVVLITSSAGFGKTALLAHLVNRWQDKDYFIAYHFFSQRGDNITRSIVNAYRNLLWQLLIHYELGSKPLANDENQLRDMLYGLVKDWKAKDGKPLVIVLDALDEAECPFYPPFPNQLPENVYVIASARTEKGEEPRYLESWTDNSQQLHLERLSKGAIADWLRRTGEGELAELADNTYFVTQLDEITQGFPLYLHYLTDELSHVTKQGQDVWKILTQTPSEFNRYVKQQLKRLEELDLPDERWQFFALLAVAKGVLEKEDIKVLTGMRDRQLRQLHQCWQVTRWMRITEDKFFAFAHPLLSTTFVAELGDDALDALEKLIDYCANWQEHQSCYALRHYVEHLRQGEQWDKLYAIARNQDFAAAQREYLPNEPDLPLKTVQTALVGAAEMDNAGAMAEFMLVHAYQLLGQESPLEALRKGSVEKAWKLADWYDIESRTLWYLLLAWELKDTGYLTRAWETLKRLQNYELPHFSIRSSTTWHGDFAVYFLTHLFEVNEDSYTSLTQQILDDYHRRYLCDILRENRNFPAAFKTVATISLELDQVFPLEMIAKTQAENGNRQARKAAQDTLVKALEITCKFFQYPPCVWQIGNIAKVQIEELEDREAARTTFTNAIETAASISDVDLKLWVFVTIADMQADLGMYTESLRTLHKIDGLLEQESLLKDIARVLFKVGEQEKALRTFSRAKQVALGIEDENEREESLLIIAMAQAEIQEFTNDALLTYKEINGRLYKEQVLETILRTQMQAEGFPFRAAAVTTTKIDEPNIKARGLKIIAIAQAQASPLTDDALKTAGQIESESQQTEALLAIVTARAEAGDILGALKIKNNIHSKYGIQQALLAIAKEYAKIKNYETAYEIAEQIKNKLHRIEALVAIVTVQAEAGDIPAALKTKDMIQDENQTQQALSAIAKAYMQAKDYKTALEIATGINIPPMRAKTLESIAKAQVASGKADDARATFATVLQSEQQRLISIPYIRSFALAEIAEVQVRNNQKEKGIANIGIARTIAQKIENSAESANILAKIARILVDAGKIKSAKSICKDAFEASQKISENREDQRSESLKLVAEAQARTGDFDAAYKTALMIKMDFSCVKALSTIAQVQIKVDGQHKDKWNEILTNAYKTYENKPLGLWNRVQILSTIAIARVMMGDETALATFTNLLEAARALRPQERDRDLAAISAGLAKAGETSAALKITNEIEDASERLKALWTITWKQFEKREKVTTLDAALEAKDKIVDQEKYLQALNTIAQIQAIAGQGREAVRTADTLLFYRNWYLPKIASWLAETGDKENFKRLLIKSAYYLDAAYEMCGYLARLYPHEQTTAVAKVVSELHG